MEVKLTVVGIRNYTGNREAGYPELKENLQKDPTVYLEIVPEGKKYPGSIAVKDNHDKQIGSISWVEKHLIKLEIDAESMLPVTFSEFSAKDNCFYVTAENTRGFAEPYIGQLKPEEGETTFLLSPLDSQLMSSIKFMKTQLRLVMDGKTNDVGPLLEAAQQYAEVCCASLDGKSTFARVEILQKLRVLSEKYPQLKDVCQDIFEQHKDMAKTEARSETFQAQYNRIKESATENQSLEAYRSKLSIMQGGELTQKVIDAEVQHLNELLAHDVSNNQKEYSEEPDKFSTNLYYKAYDMKSLYLVCARRIKRDYLRGMFSTRKDIPPMPEALATPQANIYWKRLQEAGLVDKNCQLPETVNNEGKIERTTSRLQAMYIAHLMSLKLFNGYNKWAPFEYFWGINNLAQDFRKFHEDDPLPIPLQKIKKLFED